MKWIELNGVVYDFLIDHGVIDVKDIRHIGNYFMKKQNILFWFIKSAFFMLLSLDQTICIKCFKALVTQKVKWISLNNQPCLARHILIGLNWDELDYYPFMVSLDRCGVSSNTRDDLSERIVFQIK